MFSDMRFFVRLFVLFNLYALIAANSGSYLPHLIKEFEFTVSYSLIFGYDVQA